MILFIDFLFYFFFLKGTADWHLLRRFSLTSSQGNKAFLRALPDFREKQEWKEVATYLYGNGWADILKLDATAATTAATAATAAAVAAAAVGAPAGGPPSAASDSRTGAGSGPGVSGQTATGPGPGSTAHGRATTAPPPAPADQGEQIAPQVQGATMLSLKEFAESFSNQPPQTDSPTALEDIKEVVLENKKKDHIVEGQSARYIKNFLEILCTRISQPMLCQRAIPKNIEAQRKKVKKFLDATPEQREYLFYSKAALIETAKVLNIRLKSSDSSVDKIVAVLANPRPAAQTTNDTRGREQGCPEGTVVVRQPSTTEEKVIASIFERSFQAHQKGPSREYCSLGHKLELPILFKWVKEIECLRDFPMRFLKIRSAYTAGLVEKRGCPWAKDSIDFILNVQNVVLGGDEDEIETWGCEIKSRVTQTTATAEDASLLNSDRDKHSLVSFKDVHSLLPEVQERYQLLHHAYVYNFDKVVLIVGDSQSEIIQSTVVAFTQEIREAYGKVLLDIKDLALYWVYKDNGNLEDPNEEPPPTKIPDHILKLADGIKTLNGSNSLLSSFFLWETMMDMPLPLPSLRRVIPIYCAYWNQVKGGSDTITGFMDDRVLFPPRNHTNAQTSAICRIISILLVFSHRLNQIFTAKRDLDYKSLYHYRNAAIHRFTYFDTLMDAKSFFAAQISDLDKENCPHGRNNGTPGSAVAIRRQPARTRIEGAIPSRPKFLPRLTGGTPQQGNKINRRKLVKAANGELPTVSSAVKRRWNGCTGRPAKIHKINPRPKGDKKDRHREYCSLCSEKTSFFCMGCKAWFCMEAKNTKCSRGNSRTFECIEVNMFDPKHPPKQANSKFPLRATEIFESSCFIQKHKEAWDKEDENKK